MPRRVREAIAKHISESVDRAVDGFMSANEDEDTLTGQLCGLLKTRTRTVLISRETDEREEVYGPWTWAIDYTKFRSHGPRATESLVGADGIFELRVQWADSAQIKSLLFQSKLNLSSLDASIVRQALLLSNWREAAIFINYRPDEFEAFSIDEAIRSQGDRQKVQRVANLKQALGEYFLNCEIGDTELRYDAQRRRLIWQSQSGIRVATQFSLPKRLRIKVVAPRMHGQQHDAQKILLPEEIHDHRMATEDEDMIKPLLTADKLDVVKQKRVLSLSYHPDKFQDLAADLQRAANRRMAEIIEASERIRRKL